MTAVNVFLRRDRAVMMTDAALYTKDGEVVGFGQKAVALPGLRAVISCRGALMALALLAPQFPIRYRSYDDMAERASDDLRSWYDETMSVLADGGFRDVQVVVAGWSEKQDAPAGFFFDTINGVFETIKEAVTGPVLDEVEQRNLSSIGCNVPDDAPRYGVDPIRQGIPYMEAQRRMMVHSGDIAEPLRVVGGHILLSEVTRDGVSQRIVHRWNDEVGELIRPAPFVAPRPLPMPAVSAMSRQQRRAAEREARKRLTA